MQYVAVVLEDTESEFMVHFPESAGLLHARRHPRPSLSLRGRDLGVPLGAIRREWLARPRNTKSRSHPGAVRASGRDLGSPEADGAEGVDARHAFVASPASSAKEAE